MQLTALLVPTYTNAQNPLRLAKESAGPAAGSREAQALLSARLAPDMFPLSTQVRFACVQAREAVCRLRGEAFPAVINELLDEGRQAVSGRARWLMPMPGSTRRWRYSTVSPPMRWIRTDKPIAHELANGMIFDLTADQYAVTGRWRSSISM